MARGAARGGLWHGLQSAQGKPVTRFGVKREDGRAKQIEQAERHNRVAKPNFGRFVEAPVTAAGPELLCAIVLRVDLAIGAKVVCDQILILRRMVLRDFPAFRPPNVACIQLLRRFLG